VDEGARQEFAEFVAGRSAQLIRLAYVLTGDQHAAEDLLQNALVKAAAHWGRIHTAPEAYVRRIMYREQVNWLRLRARGISAGGSGVAAGTSRVRAGGGGKQAALRGALCEGAGPQPACVPPAGWLPDDRHQHRGRAGEAAPW
jgi:DNA-directed RNA polymerase specialized sigma24 family protein